MLGQQILTIDILDKFTFNSRILPQKLLISFSLKFHSVFGVLKREITELVWKTLIFGGFFVRYIKFILILIFTWDDILNHSLSSD